MQNIPSVGDIMKDWGRLGELGGIGKNTTAVLKISNFHYSRGYLPPGFLSAARPPHRLPSLAVSLAVLHLPDEPPLGLLL